ncbi:dipeptide ABC transporter ATP-binding protein [Streptomyces aculeolatus]|uniref:oligopeptide/dipeptide ABC transporter ATP-binding protein n=1 Tax=Streptomyces aculeolatus TaxID=270689 RepID=UPI001CECC1C8|nr:oligopeptide/dipeptide ABC transporter ATP-binding protein [Streptomyces aculeolatus]
MTAAENTAPPPAAAVADLRVDFPVRTGVLRRVTGMTHAVAGVSFTVPERSIVSLVGESGSGKTTTGRALLGLSPVTSGSVRLHGRELGELRRDRTLPRVAQIVYQDPYASLNPRMTLRTMLREVLTVHRTVEPGAVSGRVAELLDQVGLRAQLAGRYPHELSGGQRQRAAIARALAVEPRFIVCDEIVSALDVSIQGQILNLIQDLRRERDVSFLFISHDMGVVRHISDHVVVMYGGKVMESAPCDELFAAPRHPYTRALLRAVPVPDPRARPDAARTDPEGPRAEPPDPSAPPPGCRFQSSCPFATAECREGDSPPPAAVPAAAGHTVACHHHDTPAVRAALAERTPAP